MFDPINTGLILRKKKKDL